MMTDRFAYRLGLIALAGAMTVTGTGCSAGDSNGEPSVRIAASTHMASADMLERQNNLPAALKQYEEVLANDPQMTSAYHGLGRVHFLLGRFNDAANALVRGINVKGDIPSMHNNLGFVYLQDRNFAAAESSFRKSLELSPSFKRARMNLGVTLARQGRVTEAVEQFAMVVPREDALFNVAVVRVEEKDFESAAKVLREALMYNPDYQPAYDHVDRIERIARTESAAKVALSRLAARNAVAAFGEPVASASDSRRPTCAVADAAAVDELSEPTEIASSSATGADIGEQTARSNADAHTHDDQAEQVAGMRELSVADGDDGTTSLACDEFVGPPAIRVVDVTVAPSIDGGISSTKSESSGSIKPHQSTSVDALSAVRAESRRERPVVTPTYTAGRAANASDDE
ncbi:MAG: tetratricopeptide repeat protein [Phycisphaerae bacterium]|nr:tetratricopeptide repeat protein [Phycisphaerae bacterium]